MTRPVAPRGFALIIVLWTLVLLMFLVTEIEQAGQNEARLADNLRRAAALQAEADGAIATAAFHLLGGAPAWRADGGSRTLAVTDDTYTRRLVVRIDDMAGRINPNTAPAPLLAGLLTALGADQSTAANAAAAIVAWRFPTDAGDAAKPYQAAGRDYAPPGAPFESLDELRLVLDVTPELLTEMLPRLTIYQVAGTSLAAAEPVVRRAFAGAPSAASAAQPAGIYIVAITATAYGAGAAATRQAIVRVGPQKSGWMQILTWTRPDA